MDNKTQVNINRNDRNRIPPWAWAAIAVAALALIIGFLLVSNQPSSPTAVTPTPTPTTAVVEVTSTPNLLTPSATPLTVEVTPTPGSPTPVGPTATAVVVEVTSTPAPATVTQAVVATVTPAAQATTDPSGSSLPAATMTADEQGVLDLLTRSGNGDKVLNLRYNGTDLKIDYEISGTGAAEARNQVRSILAALAGSTLNYSKVLLTGSDTPGEVVPKIELTYDRNIITTTDWANAPDTDIYGKAETQNVQPPYNTP